MNSGSLTFVPHLFAFCEQCTNTYRKQNSRKHIEKQSGFKENSANCFALIWNKNSILFPVLPKRFPDRLPQSWRTESCTACETTADCVRAEPGSMAATSKFLLQLLSPAFLMKADLHNHIICSSVTLSHILSLPAKSQTFKDISKAERILEGLRSGFFGGEGSCSVFVWAWGFSEFENLQMDKEKCSVRSTVQFVLFAGLSAHAEL